MIRRDVFRSDYLHSSLIIIEKELRCHGELSKWRSYIIIRMILLEENKTCALSIIQNDSMILQNVTFTEFFNCLYFYVNLSHGLF